MSGTPSHRHQTTPLGETTTTPPLQLGRQANPSSDTITVAIEPPAVEEQIIELEQLHIQVVDHPDHPMTTSTHVSPESPDSISITGDAKSSNNPVKRGMHKVVKRGKHASLSAVAVGKQVGHTTVEVGRIVGHTTVEVGKKVGHTAVVVGKKAADTAIVVSKRGSKLAGSVWTDFNKFLGRGNVFELAVGIVIGTAFTAIVNSLVTDILTPILGLAWADKNLSLAFWIMRCPNNNTNCMNANYTTPQMAQAAGAVTLNWGNFMLVMINFMLISSVLFFAVKVFTAAYRRGKPPLPSSKPCPMCIKDIPIKALKCCFCASDMPVAEDSGAGDADMVTIDAEDSGSKGKHGDDDNDDKLKKGKRKRMDWATCFPCGSK